MRKNPNAEPLRVGLDARLAYRRGVGTYTANLVLALSKIDGRNEYFLFNAPESLKKVVPNKRFHWVDLPFSNAAYYEQVLLPRATADRELDFFHYVDNSASALSGLPFVLTLHDVMHTRPLGEIRPHPTFRQRLLHFYKQWAIPRSAPKAGAILTVSKFSKDRIVRTLGIRGSRVFVTPEGVDLRFFKRTQKKKGGLFKILVHGAADERKNLSNILKAGKVLADEGRDFQLVVIGMDAKELDTTRHLREEAELGIGRHVEWIGNVSSQMLSDVYAEADLLLYPSRLEGFGLPVLEAFACGVPVVTSNTTSLPEVAGDAAILVDPEDPKAIALAVKRVMDRPALRRQLVLRGLKRAKSFTWERTAKLTLHVYQAMGMMVRSSSSGKG